MGKSDLDVLDVGAGTGIFSRLLLPYKEIRTLAAVEPVEVRFAAARLVLTAQGMRVDWQRNMDKAVTPETTAKLSVVDGIFQDIPLPTASVDLIVIAQAFHWADYGGYEPAMAEFARLLRPGGRLALIWNLEDRTRGVAWVGQIRDFYEQHEDNTPQYHRGLWKAAFDTTARKTLFEPNEVERHVERMIPTSEQGVVDRVLSKSYINALDAERQAEVEAGIRKIIQRGDGVQWIDESEGTFNYPYRTVSRRPVDRADAAGSLPLRAKHDGGAGA